MNITIYYVRQYVFLYFRQVYASLTILLTRKQDSILVHSKDFIETVRCLTLDSSGEGKIQDIIIQMLNHDKNCATLYPSSSCKPSRELVATEVVKCGKVHTEVKV